MNKEQREALALEVLGLAPRRARRADSEASVTREVERERRELEESASWLGLALPPAVPDPGGRDRLMQALLGPARWSPFLTRLAALFDLAEERTAELLGRFDSPQGWTPMFPGAAHSEFDGGPRLGSARAGLVRIAAGLSFPWHRHLGEEQVFVLQGAFVDSEGIRVGPGELALRADRSAHSFEVVSERELLYAVVVGGVEFADGSRIG